MMTKIHIKSCVPHKFKDDTQAGYSSMTRRDGREGREREQKRGREKERARESGKQVGEKLQIFNFIKYLL